MFFFLVRILQTTKTSIGGIRLHKVVSGLPCKGRNPVVDPKTMFKVLTYAFPQNIYSTHEIETACPSDVDFRCENLISYLLKIVFLKDILYFKI